MCARARLNRRAFPSACKGTSAGLPQQYCGTCINTLQTCLVQWCDQSKCSSGISSASHPNTASPPPAPTSHRTAAPGRPIARDPNTGGHGFSIASPRPCTHPIGPNISYSPGMGFIVLKHSIELKSQELVLRLASVFLAHEAHSTNHVTICAHARSMSMQTPSHA